MEPCGALKNATKLCTNKDHYQSVTHGKVCEDGELGAQVSGSLKRRSQEVSRGLKRSREASEEVSRGLGRSQEASEEVSRGGLERSQEVSGGLKRSQGHPRVLCDLRLFASRAGTHPNFLAGSYGVARFRDSEPIKTDRYGRLGSPHSWMVDKGTLVLPTEHKGGFLRHHPAMLNHRSVRVLLFGPPTDFN